MLPSRGITVDEALRLGLPVRFAEFFKDGSKNTKRLGEELSLFGVFIFRAQHTLKEKGFEGTRKIVNKDPRTLSRKGELVGREGADHAFAITLLHRAPAIDLASPPE